MTGKAVTSHHGSQNVLDEVRGSILKDLDQSAEGRSRSDKKRDDTQDNR